MDKETAVAIEKLRALQEATAITVGELKEENKKWNSLLRTVLAKTVTWLLLVAGSGILFGWHLPPEIRKAIMDWAAK